MPAPNALARVAKHHCTRMAVGTTWKFGIIDEGAGERAFAISFATGAPFAIDRECPCGKPVSLPGLDTHAVEAGCVAAAGEQHGRFDAGRIVIHCTELLAAL